MRRFFPPIEDTQVQTDDYRNNTNTGTYRNLAALKLCSNIARVSSVTNVGTPERALSASHPFRLTFNILSCGRYARAYVRIRYKRICSFEILGITVTYFPNVYWNANKTIEMRPCH